MINKIKTGLIGFGTGGEFFHAPFINSLKEFELTAILERSKDKSKEHYPDARIVRTIEELLSIEEIELIVITTPNHTHFDLAMQALEAGKHVLVDKPFAVSSSEGDILIDLANRKGKIITVYHNRRFQSDFKTLQTLLLDNTLGDIIEYKASIERYRPGLRLHLWKENEIPGAGILYDLGSHLIDQVLVLFGKPEAISADLKIERPGAKVVDAFEMIFYYKNHKAIIKASMMVERPGPVFEVIGKNGSYMKYGIDQQEALLREAIMPIGEDWALEEEEFWGTLKIGEKVRTVQPQHTDFRDFYRNLFGAIKNEEPLAVRPEDANFVIHCIELAMKSNVENKAKISL